MLDTTEKPTGIKQLAINIKSTVKDSVFRDLFGNRKYALQLYQAIHPEDTDITEDDISNVTIDNILTDQQYNDLGMMVRGMLLVLLEAQSTWSVNIIIRILLYLAYTWNRYIEEPLWKYKAQPSQTGVLCYLYGKPEENTGMDSSLQGILPGGREIS